VFFSNNGGEEWIQLKNGIPGTCVMDLDIQRRENDLVVSTFGRGVYILDDYSPLRFLSKETLKKEAEIFPVKDALMFIPSNPFGFRGTGFQGANFYSAPNPQPGAVFTYYLKEGLKTLKEKRRDAEKELKKKGEDIKYPVYSELRKESEEPEAYLLITISDASGNVIRKIKTGSSKGINRVTWDFRYDPLTPVSNEPFDPTIPWNEPNRGYMALPGTYFVSLSRFLEGKFSQLAGPVEFICKPLNNTSIPAADRVVLDQFNRKTAELVRTLSAADSYKQELMNNLTYLKTAVLQSVNVPDSVYTEILDIEKSLKEFNRNLNGDDLRSRYEGNAPTSVKGRIELISGSLWITTAAPTETFIKSYDAAAAQTETLLASLKNIDARVRNIEDLLEQSGAPYTPGRFPVWRK
jgi:hypothetical protein